MEYKKTVKKYKNAKSKSKNQKSSKIQSNDHKKQSTQSLSQREENQTFEDSHNRNHGDEKQPRANSNLKEVQNQNTLAKKKNKLSPIIYCICMGILVSLLSAIIGKNIFNSTLSTNEEILITSKTCSMILFILFFLSAIISICLITKSNKTDNTAYKINIWFYTILLILSFVIGLLLFNFESYLFASIVSLIACALSIFLTYRYYVSRLSSGVLQTICSLILLYGLYISLAFTLSIK